jgi:hypothetical protein
MNKQLNTNRCCFRFRTGEGQRLTDKIVYIEALATERLLAGDSYHNVQTGALALLKIALGRASGELVESSKDPKRIQACKPVSKRSRKNAPKR